MPGVSRVGQDVAGGTIIGVLAPRTFVGGKPIAVLGAAVASHGTGVHGGPVMAQASSKTFANGIGVCRAGDAASCGHPATGSDRTFAGG